MKIVWSSSIPWRLYTAFIEITETSPNIDIDSEHTVFPIENRDLFKNGLTTIVPIIGGENV